MERKYRFEIVPPQPIILSPPSPDEVARGDWWSLIEHEGYYSFEYISGEMQGRLKQLRISVDEGKSLLRGEATAEQLLLAHGAG